MVNEVEDRSVELKAYGKGKCAMTLLYELLYLLLLTVVLNVCSH